MGDFGKLGTRALIIHFARSLVGCHYLNASEGNTPGGGADGLTTRVLKDLDDVSWKHFAIHTAATSTLGCTGRYKTAGGYKLEVDGDGDPKDSAMRKKLETYHADLNCTAKPPSQWPSFDGGGLFPRRLKKNGTIYVGESCKGIRHFDCISFINYCLVKSLGKGWKQSIDKIDKGGNTHEQFTVFQAPFPTSFMNADILLRLSPEGDHIAFVTENRILIHAAEASRGVVEEKLTRTDFTALARLNDSWLP
ncbi:MAG: hypothetical protein DIJKHBIC_02792 [Thermoanaerobaculia bacterium]|nr:hypothetical protein [Thermoanaerobaculia bacterium]